MNTKRSYITACMTLIISILALTASLMGVLNSSLYLDLLKAGTITEFLLTGSIAQDIISIPLAVLLTILSIAFLMKRDYKIFIFILGLTGYFFYSYGLYSIQAQYTSIYHVYLVIFGLSIYSIIIGLLSFDKNLANGIILSRRVQKSIALFLTAIIVVLVPLWIIISKSDVLKHVPRDTYGVFVLDLCVVFPAIAIIAYQLFRNISFGNILAGIALIKAFTICISVAFGELFQVFYGRFEPNYGGIIIFSILTVVSLVLLILYILKLKVEILNNV